MMQNAIIVDGCDSEQEITMNEEEMTKNFRGDGCGVMILMIDGGCE